MRNILLIMSTSLLLWACAATNPNSEVMVDTNAKSKKTLIGESPRTVQPSQLGAPSSIGPAE